MKTIRMMKTLAALTALSVFVVGCSGGEEQEPIRTGSGLNTAPTAKATPTPTTTVTDGTGDLSPDANESLTNINTKLDKLKKQIKNKKSGSKKADLGILAPIMGIMGVSYIASMVRNGIASYQATPDDASTGQKLLNGFRDGATNESVKHRLAKFEDQSAKQGEETRQVVIQKADETQEKVAQVDQKTDRNATITAQVGAGVLAQGADNGKKLDRIAIDLAAAREEITEQLAQILEKINGKGDKSGIAKDLEDVKKSLTSMEAANKDNAEVVAWAKKHMELAKRYGHRLALAGVDKANNPSQPKAPSDGAQAPAAPEKKAPAGPDTRPSAENEDLRAPDIES